MPLGFKKIPKKKARRVILCEYRGCPLFGEGCTANQKRKCSLYDLNLALAASGNGRYEKHLH